MSYRKLTQNVTVLFPFSRFTSDSFLCFFSSGVCHISNKKKMKTLFGRDFECGEIPWNADKIGRLR